MMMSKVPAVHRRAVRPVTDKLSGLAARASGQVMVLVCVSLVAIMGMIAVVTDQLHARPKEPDADGGG